MKIKGKEININKKILIVVGIIVLVGIGFIGKSNNKDRNNCYSREFKLRIVKEYLDGVLSPNDLIIKYNIPATSTLMKWIKMYNNHIEFKDYDPKPEVYMADTLKTTYKDRLEIVRYCLEHNRDIKGTAAKYSCKYAQLYQWVRKYEDKG